MELFSKEATGLECDVASLPSPTKIWQTVYQFSFTILRSRGFQRLIILLFYSNSNCPSSAPLINTLNGKVAQHTFCGAQKQRYSCVWVQLVSSTRKACISRQIRRYKEKGFSFTCDWSLPHCRTAQSKADQRWYCGHSMWGLSRCTPHYICRDKEANRSWQHKGIRLDLQRRIETAHTWAAPVWWLLWVQLLCSFPKI